MLKVLKNKARCKKCGDIIESRFDHDYRICSCRAIAIDGGLAYQRLMGNMEDFDLSLSEYEEVDNKS